MSEKKDADSNSIRRSSRICLRRSFVQTNNLISSPKCDVVDAKPVTDKQESCAKQLFKEPSGNESLVEENDSTVSFNGKNKHIQNSNLEVEKDSEIKCDEIKDSLTEVEILQTIVSNEDNNNSRKDKTCNTYSLPLKSNEPEESQDSKEVEIDIDSGSEISPIDDQADQDKSISSFKCKEPQEIQTCSDNIIPDDNSKLETSILDKSKVNADIDRGKIALPLTAEESEENQTNSNEVKHDDNSSELEISLVDEVGENCSDEIKLNTTGQELQTSPITLNNIPVEISEADKIASKMMHCLEEKFADKLEDTTYTEIDLTSEDIEENVTCNILDINDPDLDLNKMILNLCKGDSSLSEKIKSLPGISYILIFTKTKTLENFLTFDCVLCNPSAGRILSGRILQKHLRSQVHLLNILKLHNYSLYEEHKDSPEITLAQLPNAVYTCANNLENGAMVATAKTYRKMREDISSVVTEFLEKFNRVHENPQLHSEVEMSDDAEENISDDAEENISEMTKLHSEVEVSDDAEENISEMTKVIGSEDTSEELNTLEELNTSEELNTKTFDKVVIITSPEYSIYMEKFVNSKISAFCVTTGNLNNVASAIKCRKKFEPGRTLWLTHPEVFRIDLIEKSDMCTTCEEPLEIHVLPSMEKMTYSNYANEIQSSFIELIKKVNSFLNAESSFAILPPFPPSFLPLEDAEHDHYHKIGKGRKTFYFSTSSALIGFESLYSELSKQVIPFFLAELKNMNIQSRSIAEYFKVANSWNSYLHVESQENELQSEEYSNAKFNQWFEHINIFFANLLKPSFDENISVKPTSEEKDTDPEPVDLSDSRVSSESFDENISVKPASEEKDTDSELVDLSDSRISSENRDDQDDILNEILGDVPIIDEDSDSEIIILDSGPASPETEKPTDSENYDHTVFICFSKAHVQLVPRKQEYADNISVVVVNSALNWSEEKEKFDTFAQDYKSILFIVLLSPNLLGTENCLPICESEMCTDPLLCLDLSLDSNVEILKQVIRKYKLFILNLRKLFEKLSASFILTPMLPVKCSPQPLITKLSHERFHKLLADTNTYFTSGGSGKWSTLANEFQKSYYIRILKECHDVCEKEKIDDVLKEIKYTSNPIIWVKLAAFTFTLTSDYDEEEHKLFLKKFVDMSRSVIKRQRKDPVCYIPQEVDEISKNSFALSSILPLLQKNAQKYSAMDNNASQENITRTEEKESEKTSSEIAVNLKSTKTSFSSQETVDFSAETDKSSLTRKLEDNISTLAIKKLSQPISELVQGKNICYFKILTSPLVAATIIGPKGKTILQLKTNTKAHIELSKTGVHFPGTSDQICSIHGSFESLLTAVFLIIDIAKKKLDQTTISSAVQKNLQLKFVVPKRMAGLIIGRGGEVINKIMMDTKAYIQKFDLIDTAAQEVCFIVASDDVKKCKAAFFMILEKLKDELQKGYQGITTYPNITKPPPSEFQKGYQGITTYPNITKPPPSEFQKGYQGITTYPNITKPPPSKFQKGYQGITTYPNITKPPPSDFQKGYQGIITYPNITKPPPSVPTLTEQLSAFTKQAGSYSADATRYGQGSYYGGSQTYNNQGAGSYNNQYAAGSSYGYGNYGYPPPPLPPVSSQTYNSYANASTPVASGYSSHQSYGVREYPTISQIVSGFPVVSSQVTSSSSVSGPALSGYKNQSSEAYEIKSSGSPYNKNLSKRSRSISPKRRLSTYSPRKRLRSRSRSVVCLDHRPEPPHKRSRNRSRSRRRNYRSKFDRFSRSRSRSFRTSRSDSRDGKYRSRYRKSTPSRTDDKFSHGDSDKIGDKFSLSGALNLLDRVRDKCGALSGSLRAFTTSAKSELEIDRSKALRLIKDDHNILLLRMTANHLKSCITSAPVEEIGILSKAVEWVVYLIEHVETADKPKGDINLKAIAAASLNKTPDFTVSLIKSAFLYEGKMNPTSEEVSEAFVKVSSLQCEMVLDNN